MESNRIVEHAQRGSLTERRFWRKPFVAYRREPNTKTKQNNNTTEENMSDFKIVYLIVERGFEPNRQTFWRTAGSAFVCRDGSLNLRLDIHPGLTFNIREPKSNGERFEAENGVEKPHEEEQFPALKVAA